MSDKAKKIFEGRKTDEDDENDRDTPLMLQIFNELGPEFNRYRYAARTEKIPKKYKNFFKITEDDGSEEVLIDDEIHGLVNEKYELVSILFHDTVTDNEKIIKMKEKFPGFR